MNASNVSSAAVVAECCKIWPTPDGVISGLHFVYSAAAFLLAALFFLTLSVQHKIVEFIQDEKAGGSIGFWCPPFMCIFIGVDTLIVGLGTYNYQGTCCLVAEGVLHARYVVRSIIHPLVLISTFEQTYLTFKRRSANFCCIKFDDGHRKKNTHACSRVARASAWIYGLGMLTWTLITNISLIYEPVEPSKMRRFTTKSLNVPDPWSVDVLELSLFLIFLFYLSFEIWRYGTVLAYQMTSTCCNKWCVMFVATLLILVSYLLPVAQSIYFADLSLVIFLFANFRVELMILEDLRIARALQKNFDLKGEEMRRQSEVDFALSILDADEDGNEAVVATNPMLQDKPSSADDDVGSSRKEENGVVMVPAIQARSSSFETPQSKGAASVVESESEITSIEKDSSNEKYENVDSVDTSKHDENIVKTPAEHNVIDGNGMTVGEDSDIGISSIKISFSNNSGEELDVESDAEKNTTTSPSSTNKEVSIDEPVEKNLESAIGSTEKSVNESTEKSVNESTADVAEVQDADASKDRGSEEDST